MKNTLLIGATILIAVSLTSCGEDDGRIVDVDAPAIELEHPTGAERIAAGGDMEVHAEITDNVELASLNISIHDNFDGHAHGRTAAEFDYDQSFDISGTSFEFEEDITIPTDATAGPYHLILTAIDAEGNSTSFDDDSTVEIEIWITNNQMAHVHFTNEAEVEIDEIEGEVDVNLPIYGHIEDQQGALDHVEIIIGHHEEGADHDHDHGRISEEPLYEFDFEVEGETEVHLEALLNGATTSISAAQLAELEENEHYSVIVLVTDADGNISEYSIEIHFE